MFDTVYVRDDICVHDHVSQEKDVGTLNFSITTVFYCKRTAYLYKKKILPRLLFVEYVHGFRKIFTMLLLKYIENLHYSIS